MRLRPSRAKKNEIRGIEARQPSILLFIEEIQRDCLERLDAARSPDAIHDPGQDIKYVVVDDEKRSRERVAMAHEEIESDNPSYYQTDLVRAAESVLSPMDWDRSRIRRELAETRVPELTAFANTEEC